MCDESAVKFEIEDVYLAIELARWAAMKIENPPSEIGITLFGVVMGYLNKAENEIDNEGIEPVLCWRCLECRKLHVQKQGAKGCCDSKADGRG